MSIKTMFLARKFVYTSIFYLGKGIKCNNIQITVELQDCGESSHIYIDPQLGHFKFIDHWDPHSYRLASQFQSKRTRVMLVTKNEWLVRLVRRYLPSIQRL